MEDDQQFCLRWNNHQSTLIQNFDTLLESGTLVDCTLAAEGKYLKAHKVVLSACSPYFEGLLSEHYDKHPVFILKDVKFKELKAMMDYMYRGEVNISQDQLTALLKAAESLQIKGLSDSKTGGSTSTTGKSSDSAPTRQTKSTAGQAAATAASVDIPHTSSGLTIEKNKVPRQALQQTSVCDLPEDSASPQRKGLSSREGSISPTRKGRKRQRRRSLGNDDNNSMENHEASNSSDANLSVPALGVAAVAEDKTHADQADPVGRSALMQQLTKPADEMIQIPMEKPEPNEEIIQPKSEYLDDQESVEDLTHLDDDLNDMEMDQDSRPGPSTQDGSQHPGMAPWHNASVGAAAGVPGGNDEVFLAAQEAAQAQRDSQASPGKTTKTTTVQEQLSNDRDMMTVLQNPAAFGRRRGRTKQAHSTPYTVPKSDSLEVHSSESPLVKSTSKHKKKLKKSMPMLRVIKVESGVWSSSVVPTNDDLIPENLENTIEKLKRRVGNRASNKLVKRLKERKRGRPKKIHYSDDEEGEGNKSELSMCDDWKSPERRSKRSQKSLITYKEFQEDLEDIRNQRDIKPNIQTTENGVKKRRGRQARQSKSKVVSERCIKKRPGRPRKNTSVIKDQNLDSSKLESATPLLTLFESLQLSIQDDRELIKPEAEISRKPKPEDMPSTSQNGDYKTKMPSKSFLEQNCTLNESSKTCTTQHSSSICVRDIIPIGNIVMRNPALMKKFEQAEVRLVRMEFNPFTTKIPSNVLPSPSKDMKKKRGRPRRLHPIVSLENTKILEIEEEPITIEKEETVEAPVESNNTEIQNENNTDSVNSCEMLELQLSNTSDVVDNSDQANTSNILSVPESFDVKEDHNTDTINQPEVKIENH